ncbi:WD40 repeat domain-containing protein [Reichenbachiella carrageenanivorans]|uniref:WD40 repeat domain-containing protein n=1 Tax=Reichenbachiella carrageenanivorans TaxID=2979869 RepID=A0ABY6CUN1_9BACT|nr:WD40 repeat domain-containing protein [Reichenbachiella carrageenanivorans]UXX77637.1 WD40 repeat domain-containing protein [Reichenbachiella carrageenanivorans]
MVQIEKVITYTGHSDAVYTLECGVEPHQFYSAGGDGNIVEWDLNQTDAGRLIAKVNASVYCLRLVPERHLLVVAQNYEGIHLIDVLSHKEVGSLRFTDSAIFDMKVVGDLLLVATGEGKLIVIDLPKLKVVHELEISDQNLRDLLITSDGHCLVGSSDGYIRKYRISDFQLVKEVEAHSNSVFTLLQKGNTIISGSRDARLKFWDATTLLEDESINAHMYAINDIAERKDGAYLATASMDKTIKVWDYAQRKLIKVIDKARHQGHLTSVNKLLWMEYKDFLISCSDDRSIGVWRIDIKK